MKKWIIIILVVIVALIIIGVLHENGYLNFKWNTLTIIFAALAGPYTYIKNKLFNRNDSDELAALLNQNKEARQNDALHREQFDAMESSQQAEIQRLQEQVAVLNTKNEELKSQAANVHNEVREMSSEEMAKAFEQLYGNLKDE